MTDALQVQAAKFRGSRPAVLTILLLLFIITPALHAQTWTVLHNFTGGSDGGTPYSNVVIDTNGNLYGTTTVGGTGQACKGGCGVVWEITP